MAAGPLSRNEGAAEHSSLLLSRSRWAHSKSVSIVERGEGQQGSAVPELSNYGGANVSLLLHSS